MSIKVMTWVWDNSPAAGTDLLMLLAIADQANEDGRDAWPSVTDLARRTRLSERTVHRVLQRLSDDGHLVITTGGGRRRNRYAVVMDSASSTESESSTPLTDCHPRQNDTPDRSSGHPCRSSDSAAVTQLCHPTPDTAVSPVPSYPVLTPSTSSARVHGRLRIVSAADGGGGVDPGVVEVLTGLGPQWTLSPTQRRRLAPMVSTALGNGWTAAGLIEHLAANPEGVRSPAAVLAARLDDLPEPRTAEVPAKRPTWCGSCDETTRHRERADGSVERCPACHPRRASEQTAGEDPARHRSRQAPTPRRVSSQGASTPHNRKEHHQCPPQSRQDVS